MGNIFRRMLNAFKLTILNAQIGTVVVLALLPSCERGSSSVSPDPKRIQALQDLIAGLSQEREALRAQLAQCTQNEQTAHGVSPGGTDRLNADKSKEDNLWWCSGGYCMETKESCERRRKTIAYRIDTSQLQEEGDGRRTTILWNIRTNSPEKVNAEDIASALASNEYTASPLTKGVSVGPSAPRCLGQKSAACLARKSILSGEVENTCFSTISSCTESRNNAALYPPADWQIVVDCAASQTEEAKKSLMKTPRSVIELRRR